MDTHPLSPRETTVLHLIAWGYTNKEIAARLDLSVKTIEAHKANGMRKLHLSSRYELVRKAVEWGWFSKAEAPDEPAISSPASAPSIGRPGSAHGAAETRSER
jgi:DNA-binding CsgD family transcriptional regulator